MFRVDDITTIDVESINNCNARCPLCLRGSGMKTNDILDWDHIVNNIPLEVWQSVSKINFNGTTGDNLMHPKIDEIIQWVCKNTSAFVSIHTNGSIRHTNWWHDFGSQLKSYQHRVVFGIDGLEDTHKIYRVGTDWQKIINNASAFIQGGGSAEWQFIIFEHNAHQVNQARELSEQLGFEKFYVVYQDRFDATAKDNVVDRYTGNLQKIDALTIVKTSSNNIKHRIESSDKKINCRSQRIGWISIYADGTVWPCCWLMGWHKAKHQKEFLLVDYHFKKILNIDFSQINLYNNKLTDIVNSELWQQRYPDSFVGRQNPICLQQCSGNKNDTY